MFTWEGGREDGRDIDVESIWWQFWLVQELNQGGKDLFNDGA